MASESKPRKRAAAAASEGVDDALEAMAARAAALNAGKAKFTRTSALNTLIGMPTKALSQSWLLQCNTIPFSRAVQIVGPPGSAKTMFQIDLMGGVLASGDRNLPGQALYCENENKPSLDLVWSLLENRADLEGQIINVAKTGLMDEWTAAMNAKVTEWEGLFDPVIGKDKFGWRVPLFMGLDSLMSTMTAASYAKYKATGVFDQGFPAEANALARFGRQLPKMIGGRPILLVVTNHLKPFTDPNTGMPKRNVPGGQAFAYMESVEFELKRVAKIEKNAQKGLLIKVKAFKNCVGDSSREIEVPVVWEYDAADPNTPERARTQWTMWDWHGTSIQLIRDLKAKDATRWAKVDEVLDIHDAKGGKGYGWSNALGVPSSSRASVHELGCMLEERPDILEALYPILDIRQGRFFRFGQDYQKMAADDSASPDPQSAREFTRPACGNLARRLTAGEDGVDTEAWG